MTILNSVNPIQDLICLAFHFFIICISSQDDETTLPKAGHKKHKEKSMEASLFDDNVDIFADLTMSSGPKEKAKKKMDTKSIFDDDMGKPLFRGVLCDHFQMPIIRVSVRMTL